MKIGRLSLLDPARKSVKQKELDDEIENVVAKVFLEKSQFVALAVANEKAGIAAALKQLCDRDKCPLVLTFGGTGPAATDIMPDVTMEVIDRKLPGFGEVMRYYSYERFKVSVLSRAEAGVRGKSLVINLPAKSKPVRFCLRLLQEGIAEALEQISGITPGLRGDEIEVPIDKYLPFLKKLRPKINPNDEGHPTFGSS
jgi:molybdopterin adenylyltransferase